MIGRQLDRLYPERMPTATDRVALKVRDLSVRQPPARASSFDLREGEVLGVGGLQGHGQRELFQALFGAGRGDAARVELWGKPRRSRNPRQALIGRDGIALVPEDRRGQGLLLTKSVRENLTLVGHPALHATAASSTAASESGAGRRRWSISCASRRRRPTSSPARSPAATSRR